MMKISVDGRLTDPASFGVDQSGLDRLFADGVEEWAALRGGRARRFDAVYGRIVAGARAVGFDWSARPTQLQGWIARLAEDTGHGSGVVRILAGRAAATGTSMIVIATAIRPTVDVVCAAVAAGVARAAPPEPFTRIVGPERVAAKAALASRDAEAAIVLNSHGRVAGTVGGDLFALIDGVLVTPPRSEFATAGATRDDVIRLARAEERPIALEALRTAPEIAVADGIGLRPVIDLDGVAVGGGELGLITGLLAARV